MSPDPDHEPEDDWGYTEDPTAPPTVDGKLTEMGKDLRKLTRAALLATLIVAAGLFVVELVGGKGFGTTCGFVVGGTLATINLWILAGGYFAIIDQRAMLARVLLAAAGSLTVLLGTALYILVAHREWTVGFALGLSIPALGGILFAVQKNREEG
jgi:hypothetical protein